MQLIAPLLRCSINVDANEPWPDGARPDLTVQATIDLERVADAVYVVRPTNAEAHATVQLWKLVGDDEAVRVPVELGRLSARTVEVKRGLVAGDRMVVSDMSQWDHVARVRLR